MRFSLIALAVMLLLVPSVQADKSSASCPRMEMSVSGRQVQDPPMGVPQFKTPEHVQFALRGAPANTEFESCAIYYRPDLVGKQQPLHPVCVTRKTDAHGSASDKVQVLGISVGYWDRWAQIGSCKSTSARYIVLE